jgi:hypothetical protein
MKRQNHSTGVESKYTTLGRPSHITSDLASRVKPRAIPKADDKPFPANSGTPGEQKVKVSTTPKRGGVFFRSPLTGTVLAATAACFRVKTRSTPLGTLVTAVDQFNWDQYGGLKYWVEGASPSMAADQCQCKCGDIISWYGAAR